MQDRLKAPGPAAREPLHGLARRIVDDAVVYRPFGGAVAGPMHGEKGLLIAETDVAAARASCRKFDANGHYARPDVFSLTVNRKKQVPVLFG